MKLNFELDEKEFLNTISPYVKKWLAQEFEIEEPKEFDDVDLASFLHIPLMEMCKESPCRKLHTKEFLCFILNIVYFSNNYVITLTNKEISEICHIPISISTINKMLNFFQRLGIISKEIYYEKSKEKGTYRIRRIIFNSSFFVDELLKIIDENSLRAKN